MLRDDILHLLKRKGKITYQNLAQYFWYRPRGYHPTENEIITSLVLLEKREHVKYNETNDEWQYASPSRQPILLECPNCHNRQMYIAQAKQDRHRIKCKQCEETREVSKWNRIGDADQLKTRLRNKGTNNKLEKEIMDLIDAKTATHTSLIAKKLELPIYRISRIINKMVKDGKIVVAKTEQRIKYYKLHPTPNDVVQPVQSAHPMKKVGRLHNLMYKAHLFFLPEVFHYDKFVTMKNWKRPKFIIRTHDWVMEICIHVIIFRNRNSFFETSIQNAKKRKIQGLTDVVAGPIRELEALGFNISHEVQFCGKEHLAIKVGGELVELAKANASVGDGHFDESDDIPEFEDTIENFESLYALPKQMQVKESQIAKLQVENQTLQQKINKLEGKVTEAVVIQSTLEKVQALESKVLTTSTDLSMLQLDHQETRSLTDRLTNVVTDSQKRIIKLETGEN